MNIQIVSDLHIEYKNDLVPDPLDFITPSADILILAGDIGSLYKLNQLSTFLKKLCSHFQLVLYTLGNHEFYYFNESNLKTMNELLDDLMVIKEKIPNLYILNRSSLLINGICFSGATLWSKAECNIPKYIVKINEMTTKLYLDMHEEDLAYINSMIRYCKKKNYKHVIITHHCPSYRVLDRTYKNNNRFASLYATNLDHLLRKNNVDTWISGHNHCNFDYITDGGTRVVSNQLGKPIDNITDFSKEFIITL